MEKALLRYIAAGLGVSYEQLPGIIHRSVIPVPGHPPMSRGVFYGKTKICGQSPGVTDVCRWLEEALIRGVIRPPKSRFSSGRPVPGGAVPSGLVPVVWR